MSVEVYRGRSGWRYLVDGRDDGDYLTEDLARQAGQMFEARQMPSQFTDMDRVDDCDQAGSVPVEAGGIEWNEWERGFLTSIRQTLERGGDLSEAQRHALNKLHERT